mgnify:CR=1 FL=1
MFELLEERGLEPGPSPTRDDPDWTRPRRVAWRNLWPERVATLQAVAPDVEIVPFRTAEEAVEAVAGGQVRILRYDADTDPAGGFLVASLDDKLCRFLTAGDIDLTELVAGDRGRSRPGHLPPAQST